MPEIFEPFCTGPNGIGMALDPGYVQGTTVLRATSPCCNSEIHLDLDTPPTTGSYTWLCAKCRTFIMKGNESSVFYIYGSIDGGTANIWVAGWFQVETDQVQVSIDA